MPIGEPNPTPEPGPGAGPRGEFVVLLTSSQRMLYAYIVTLLGQPGSAEDVLQSVNLKVWEKADQFEPGTNFGAWVRQIAYRTVQEHWRSTRRGQSLRARLRLIECAHEHYQRNNELQEERQSALEYCISLLPDHQRRWIDRRYRENKPVSEIAADKGCSAASVAQALYRVRMLLRRCIERRVHGELKGGRHG